jgi:hypothetical protein
MPVTAMPTNTSLLLALALLVALPAAADVDGHQLKVFQQEADAFNAEKPEANRYRAGFYSGYLTGMLEALQGRSVCFNGCRCEIEAKVAEYLQSHPEAMDQPVSPWLARLLEESYPCPK